VQFVGYEPHKFIRQTGLTKYFYINYCNAHPDENVNKELFQYPGPNPFTREQAILMMADTVEAASRSLNEYTEERT
jgi:cyclic-di-AMP phosphodiesterase PgpH